MQSWSVFPQRCCMRRAGGLCVEIKWYERVPDATLTVRLRLRAGGPQASSSVATTAPPYKYKRLPLHS